jgi:hypothetical protein
LILFLIYFLTAAFYHITYRAPSAKPRLALYRFADYFDFCAGFRVPSFLSIDIIL